MRIIRRRLPDGTHSFNDGAAIIVDDRLDSVQLFCAVQHELVHLERGQTTHAPGTRFEQDVRYETARRCLPVESMVGACRGSLEQTAQALEVTPRVLMDRADVLTDDEARLLGCDTCRACPSMKYRFPRTEAF
jgi:hypothetical protein